MSLSTKIFGRIAYKLSLLVTTLLILTSWDVPNDIRDLGAKISQKRYHTNLNIFLLKDIKMKDTIEKQQVEFRVFNNYLCYKIKNYEAYANPKYGFVVDHTNKIIIINDNRPGKPFKVNIKMDMINIDTLLTMEYEFKLAKNSPNSKTYVISTSDPKKEIDYLYYTFNPTLLIPQKIFLKYNKNLDYLLSNVRNDKAEKNEQKPILVMVYNNFEYDNLFVAEHYQHDHILKIDKKNKAIVADKYKNYKIFNYLNQK